MDIKESFALIIAILFITDLAIFLNIPLLRQILGFLFLTILPGVLIIQILKLNKIELTEKLVLSVGLSISFLMFFGLLLNNSLPGLGYRSPLSTIPLLISFNVVAIALTLVAYRLNKNAVFSLPNVNLTTSEKAFLIVPILFPALSIFGMHVMNITDNNTILMFLLFLIPIYVAFVCFFNNKFSKRMYPVVIFLISISLLLMLALRSNHIIGADRHVEYYYFQTTLNNLYWSMFGHSALDACLAISLLPAIYQSILNTNQEYLFKIVIPVIYSISPLIIYIIAKKYIGEIYAFLASFFFMSQPMFLLSSGGRTVMAILFFALAMMTLFNDRIDPLKKRILFIVFMASCMVSHYSTTYIFFFIMLGTFVGMEMLSKKYTFKKAVSLTTVVLFFAFIFFWYSQVTETAFNVGVAFIENTFINLNKFFIAESSGAGMQYLFGQKMAEEETPYKIILFFTWMTLAFIGIGIITLIRRYKEMSFSELGFKKAEFLRDKFEVGYFVTALVLSGLLVAIVALPFISTQYNIGRSYAVAITILSVFFVIGGITLSKHFFFFVSKSLYGKFASQKTCAKRKNNSFFGKAFFSKETFMTHGDTHEHENNKVFSYQRFDGKNVTQNPFRKGGDEKDTSEVRTHLVILLVLIPYFFCATGMTYQVFGVPRTITLNSEGAQYDIMYVHDQESCAAKWLKRHTEERAKIYADLYGDFRLKSQGVIRLPIYAESFIKDKKPIRGYIYLRYANVAGGKLLDSGYQLHNLTEYTHLFVGMDKIYDNRGSEVWK